MDVSALHQKFGKLTRTVLMSKFGVRHNVTRRAVSHAGRGRSITPRGSTTDRGTGPGWRSFAKKHVHPSCSRRPAAGGSLGWTRRSWATSWAYDRAALHQRTGAKMRTATQHAPGQQGATHMCAGQHRHPRTRHAQVVNPPPGPPAPGVSQAGTRRWRNVADHAPPDPWRRSRPNPRPRQPNATPHAPRSRTRQTRTATQGSTANPTRAEHKNKKRLPAIPKTRIDCAAGRSAARTPGRFTPQPAPLPAQQTGRATPAAGKSSPIGSKVKAFDIASRAGIPLGRESRNRNATDRPAGATDTGRERGLCGRGPSPQVRKSLGARPPPRPGRTGPLRSRGSRKSCP